MTPSQIEAAARALCRIRGFDPDGLPDYPHPLPHCGIAMCWQCYAPEVERFAQVGTAIAAAMQEQPKRQRKAKPK